MKIILENTDKYVTVNGVPARVWEGKTEAGVPCFAMITRVGVSQDEDASAFERELKATEPVKAELSGPFPLRLVL